MTPKFNALVWTTGCGCGDSPTKAVCEVVQSGAGNGLLLRHGNDDVILVTQYSGGVKVVDAQPMTAEEVETLL